MSVYNSSVGSHQDDSDITIINPSIIHEHNDEYVNNTYVPIITRLKQANNSSETRQILADPQRNNTKCENSDGKNDYIFVDHNPQENAKQVEQILIFYIRDLKKESNTQLDCNRELITRLVDLIRIAYPNDQKKMIELDGILEEIGSLHNIRHVEQNEKMEQLRTEICQLQKMLIAGPNDHSMINEESNRNYSLANTIYRTNSINDHWTEIEDDTKKLHEIVQSQRNQINEIVTLISETATSPTSLEPTNTAIDDVEDTSTNNQATPTTNNNFISTLLKRIQDITGPQQKQDPMTTGVTPPATILENHSPGISPGQSMATLTLESLQLPSGNRTQEDEKPVENPIINQEPVLEEPPHVQFNIKLPSPPPTASPNETKKCPVCSHEFFSTSDDVEMYDHIEKCLFPTGIITDPQEYECPNCNRKLAGSDEAGYLQHLSDCFNNDI